jgi:hypothetical protein
LTVLRLGCRRPTFRLWTNAMHLITTANVPPRDRLDFWGETIARSALQFRMEPVEQAPCVEVRLANMGSLAMMHIDGAMATRYRRTRVEIARSQGPYDFFAPTSGRPSAREGQRQNDASVRRADQRAASAPRRERRDRDRPRQASPTPSFCAAVSFGLAPGGARSRIPAKPSSL